MGWGEEAGAEQGQEVQKQHKRDQEGQEGRKVEKDCRFSSRGMVGGVGHLRESSMLVPLGWGCILAEPLASPPLLLD